MKSKYAPIIPSKEFSTLVHHKDCALHRHTNCEILFILSGTAKNCINEMETEAKQGNIFFVNNNVTHCLEATTSPYAHRDVYISSKAVQTLCNQFWDEKFFEYLMSPNQIIQFPVSFEEFSSYVSRLQQLQTLNHLYPEKKSSIEKAILVIIVSLLGILYEQSQNDLLHKESWLEKFLMKVQSPAIFTLPLEEIIRMSNYSHSYFSHIFRETFHTTFKAYINKMKLSYAKDLLVDPTISIIDVAQNCGFSTQSHFTKFFKENTGLTPYQYRKKKLDKIENPI